MANKGSIYAYPTEWDTVELWWWVSAQDVVKNTSTISWSLILYSGDYGAINSTTSKFWTVSIGSTTAGNYTSIGIGNNTSRELASGSTTVTHNADGTYSTTMGFSLDFKISFSGTYIGTVKASEVIELDRISKAATITNAPHFNDEENPTITYSNLAGDLVESLQACISINGSKDDIAYRDIDKKGTSYTFNLTEEERNILRYATINSSTLAVKFYVKTVFNGETFYSTLTKILTIVNANPTMNPAAMCWDDATISLTGSTEYFIKDFSDAKIEFNAQAFKGATIKNKEVICGYKTLTEDGIIEDVPTSAFVFKVTDSRGYSTTKTITKVLIDYFKPTCDLKAGKMSASGEIALVIQGQYFNSSFVGIQNSLTIELAYKIASSDTYEVVTVEDITLDGNSYTAYITLEGLDYRELYNFQAIAIDRLGEAVSAVLAVRSIPVFDWSGTDFNFNVPVAAKTINGKDNLTINGNEKLVITGDEIDLVSDNIKINGIAFGAEEDSGNKILWEGNSHMNNTQTITLSETVSKQKTGIVLVFSQYDYTNGALDTGVNSFFISKAQVELMPGAAHSFVLAGDSKFSNMGAKTLSIYDGYIGGYSGNTDGGAAGFKYTNSNYVLRYVIGV